MNVEGEFAKRRIYQEIAGVPLLLMANGLTVAFPSSQRESCALVPDAMHILLPALRESFLHPVATISSIKLNAMFENDVTFVNSLLATPLFKDVVLIRDLSTKFIKVRMLLPICNSSRLLLI